MSRRKPTATLEQKIGHSFKDKSLLVQALTHVSAIAHGKVKVSYQRFEFLGDHVLGLVISDLLLREYPRAQEGELSQRLADLVRAETCAKVAVELNLGAYMYFGTNEAKSGGRHKGSILADVCEALIGAVFLDGGYAAATKLVDKFWNERMHAAARPPRDAKTALQEWAQGRGLPTPSYKEVERKGPHHNPEFRVAVVLPDRDPAEGQGKSKRAAEQAAAAAMLAREGVEFAKSGH
jgi:ribonuclease-3